MLGSELKNESYNKTAVRRGVLPSLNGRSHSSLEKKNQNISAVLIKYGYPFIDGYKPLSNYQGLLDTLVQKELERRLDVLAVMETYVSSNVSTPSIPNYLDIFDTDTPVANFNARAVEDQSSEYNPRKTNFLQKEAHNQSVGLQGELIALEYEKQRLIYAGKDNLADKIEHTSQEFGDGAGFDIRSFNRNGSDRFIEVKSTRFRKENPFFISSNELQFSQSHQNNYSLYRVYHLEKSPRMFSLNGDITRACILDPTQYRASF